MNIKEIEERSGLTRANIRYYEKEGLLSPERRENRYRDYSEKDLDLLKKIRLMRELGISLEQIRRLIENPTDLKEIMCQRVQDMEKEVLELNDAATVCSEIQYEGVSFEGMETDRYFSRLQQLAKEREHGQGIARVQEVIQVDQEPFQAYPWRRFLARVFDFQICSWLVVLIWNGLLHQMMGRGFWYDLLHTVSAMVVMLFLEPFFLSRFGTTPGKWIFGLSVSDQDGKRLTYSEGLKRTANVFLRGMGLGIPGFELYCLYRSYRIYTDGRGLSWDWEGQGFSEVSYEEREIWKTVVCCILIPGIVYGSTVLISLYQLLPPNRGELTVEEFAENYNYYVDLTSMREQWSPEESDYLDEKGQYRERILNPNEVYFNILKNEVPVWNYQIENGRISEASFEVQMRTSGLIGSYDAQMTYGILALGGAWADASIWNMAVYRLAKQTDEIGFGDFEFTDYGLHVTCEMEHDGEKIPEMEKNAGWLHGNGIHEFHIRFVMEPSES